MLSHLFPKLFECDTAAIPPKSIPTLYPDIIDHILAIVNEWYPPERQETLLRSALVCREWCTIARRYSFTAIHGITPYELHHLRKIMVHPNTFSKHIRTATFRIYMENDEWSDVKEMLDLMRTLWTGSMTLRDGSLFAWHLFELSSSMSKLTHLELSQLKLVITKDDLAQFLRSAPQLRNLSLDSVGWWIEENSLHYATVGSSGRNTEQRMKIGKKSWKDNDYPLILDCLHISLQTCDEEDYPFTERLWPHILFKNLMVHTLIMAVDSGAQAFEWDTATEMVQSISSNLVELDLAHEPMDYNCDFLEKISKFSFPKLRTLKLVLGAQEDDRGSEEMHSVEKAFQKALSRMVMPDLQQVVIFVTEELVYLAGLGSVSTYTKEEDSMCVPMSIEYDWGIIDRTIQAIAHPTHQSASMSTKFIIASEPFFLDTYSDFDVDSVFTYMKSCCPKTVSDRVQLEFKIASRGTETGHFN